MGSADGRRTFQLLDDNPFNVKLLEKSLNEIKENSFDILYRAQYKMNDMTRFDLMMGEFTLTFNANEGNCDYINKIVRYKKRYGNLPRATRTGYIFRGWYTSEEGGIQVSYNDIVTKLEDHTLYARWILDTGDIDTSRINTKLGDPDKVTETNVNIIGKRKILNTSIYKSEDSVTTLQPSAEEMFVYDIPINFINYSLREEYRTSRYYKKYVTMEDIAKAPKVFSNTLLLFIDGELHSHYKVKPVENITTVGFTVSGFANEVIRWEMDENNNQYIVPRNFFTLAEFREMAEFNCHMTIFVVSNCNAMISKIQTLDAIRRYQDNGFYIDERYETPYNQLSIMDPVMTFITTDEIRLYKHRFIDSERLTETASINGQPSGREFIRFNPNQLTVLPTKVPTYTRLLSMHLLNRFKTIDIPYDDIIYRDGHSRYFQLDIQDMPVPIENMMVFKLRHNEWYFDHTATIEMYYPNIYRIVTEHQNDIRVFVFYDDDTTEVLGKHDNEVKVYHRFVKDLLDRYKNDTVYDYVKDYVPIKKPYSINDYEDHLTTDINGHIVYSGLTPLEYKINKFLELIKLRGENYCIYLNKLIGYTPTYYVNLDGDTLPDKLTHNNSQVLYHSNDYELENFIEPHYLFIFRKENFNDNIVVFLDNKLYYPTKVYPTEEYKFVYIPTRLITADTIFEVAKGVDRRLRRTFEYDQAYMEYFEVPLPPHINASVDDIYIVYEGEDGKEKYLSEKDYEIFIKNTTVYKDSKDTEWFRYPTVYIRLHCEDKSITGQYKIQVSNINFNYRNEGDTTFYITKDVNNDNRNIRMFKNGKLVPVAGHKVRFNKDNVHGVHKMKVLMTSEPEDEFVFSYSDIKRGLVYYEQKIHPKGYVDVEGLLEKPLSHRWYDFYINGNRLTVDNIDFITPTKLVVQGVNTRLNFKIFEKDLFQADDAYDTNYIDDEIVKLPGFLDEILENYDELPDDEDDIMDELIVDLIDFIDEFWIYIEFINPNLQQITDEMIELYPLVFDDNGCLFLGYSKYPNIEFNIFINPNVSGVPYIRKEVHRN